MILIGIAGGTASGKTTVAKKIHQALHEDVVLIEQDCYYKDMAHLTVEERAALNFDHPDAFDLTFMCQQLSKLKDKVAIEKPQYDFCNHTRRADSLHVAPTRIVIVEGILLFAMPELRDLFDLKIYVDTEDDIRLLRRITRDISERGRDLPSVSRQYLETVRPMHLEFIEPSKRYADIIIPRGGENITAINLIISKLRAELMFQNQES